MASKKAEAMAAAGAGVFDKFFSQAPQETAQEAQEAPKTNLAGISSPDRMEGQDGAKAKATKKVFSFRAEPDNIKTWKAYAAAQGLQMDQLGAAALQEYIKSHPLTTEDQEAVYRVHMER